MTDTEQPDAGEDRWTEYMPIDDLPGAPRNPKRHRHDDIDQSFDRFGYVEAMVLDERTGRLVAGHGRRDQLRARKANGHPPPRGIRVDRDGRWLAPVQRGWASRDDLDAEGYLMASNRLTEAGGWDIDQLTDMLGDQVDMSGLGWDDDEIQHLLAPGVDDDAGAGDDDGLDGEDDTPEPGQLLALAGVTVGEPAFDTETGQIWRLGRHRLAVVDVMTGWPTWWPLLTGDALFVPYPNLLAPHTEVAKRRPLVMVQPNRYLAGWLLTKWQAITGDTPTVEGS